MFHGFRDDPEQVHQVGRPEREPRPVVTWTLLAANVVVWLLTFAAGGTDNPDVLLDFGAMFGPLIASGEYWRLFTAMFLHAGIPHLAFNCLAYSFSDRRSSAPTADPASRSSTSSQDCPAA